MYFYSRAELAKGDRYCILQGMRHHAPDWVYQEIQAELDELISLGFTLLYENMQDPDRGTALRGNAKRIHEFFVTANAIVSEAQEEEHNFAEQFKLMRNPEGSFRVDMTRSEVCQLLDASGFRMSKWTLRLFNSDFYEKWFIIFRSRVERQRQDGTLGNLFSRMAKRLFLLSLDTTDFLPIPFYVNRRTFRRMQPVLIEARNRLVAEYIEGEGAHLEKMVITYGQDHITGISNLLVQSGWELKLGVNI